MANETKNFQLNLLNI